MKKSTKMFFMLLLLINTIFAVEIIAMQLKWTKQFIDLTGTIGVLLILVILLGLYLIFQYMKPKRK